MVHGEHLCAPAPGPEAACETRAMGNTLGAWLDRDVLSATGPDAAKFLQGQMSQDLEAQPVGTGRWSLLLNPQGRMVAWVLVHRVADDGYLLEVEAGFADAVAAQGLDVASVAIEEMRGDPAFVLGESAQAMTGVNGFLAETLLYRAMNHALQLVAMNR